MRFRAEIGEDLPTGTSVRHRTGLPRAMMEAFPWKHSKGMWMWCSGEWFCGVGFTVGLGDLGGLSQP